MSVLFPGLVFFSREISRFIDALRKMASSKLPVPFPMEVKGDLRDNWNFFESQWNNYEVATGLEGKDDKIRAATLLSVVGKDCYRIFQHLDMPEDDRAKVSAILKSLKEHFIPKTNVIYERYVFNTTDQLQNESVDVYVTRLRGLSNSCEFGALQNQMIRDRIVLGTKDSGARSRMLREPDLTLEKAVDMCRASEIADHQMRKLSSTEEVNYTSKQKVTKNFDKRKQHKLSTSEQKEQSMCRYCGGTHGKKDCPAYGKACSKCKKKNHFAKVCLQSSRPKVNIVEETDSDESIYTLNALTDKQWFVNVTMSVQNNNKTVKCQIDTGASCNVISTSVLSSITKQKKLRITPTKTKLKLYDGGTLIPVGKCTINCTVGKVTETLEFHVVEIEGKDTSTLLSAAASVKLGIMTVNVVNSVLQTPETTLTEENILQEYSDVFNGLGCLPGTYSIEIDKTMKPVQHQPRRVPVAQKAEVKAEIERLVNKGVITKVVEPTDWISSMVVVRKPNKLRVCLDPKDLNKAIKRSKYMMPTIDDILPKVSKGKVFTVLDAKDGFWQVKLEEKSSYLTTFWTPFGRYRWLRLPFGISSAPEEFQRRQHEALEGLQGTEVIVDDILVYGQGETMEEAIRDHDEKLVKVLERARAVGLKLNKDKLKLRQTEVSYMGHVLTSSGVRADPTKIQAILDMPKPTDLKGVRRFLGFVTYLSKFLPHLSEACEPLRRLTTKDTLWYWESQQEEAFATIKRLVTEQPVLRYYDLEEEVTLQCDASEAGLGATLLQKGQPVAFASRALSTAEKHYAQIEKECLAIVFACERFEHYIYGRSLVTVHTDHKPLETIYKKPLLNAPKRLQRMLLRLQKYSLCLQYTKGTEMYIADTLSRAFLPMTQTDKDNTAEVFNVQEQKLQEDLAAINFAETVNVTEQRFKQIQVHSYQDEALQTLKSVILSGWPDLKAEVPVLIREYWNIRDELSVQDGMVYKGCKIVVPKTLRSEMLTRIHASHMGVESCLRKSRDVLYWPNMNNEISDHIEKCSICNEYSSKQQKETLITHDVPDRPWSKVGVDIFTLKQSDYLVTVDYYSDFWELDLLPDTTSATIINCLKGHFSRHGIPDTLVSDNGPQLCSVEFNKFSQQWEFDHVTSSPYHSQSNGKAESAVKIAKGLVKKAIRSNRDIWKTILDWRNTPTETMDSSPAQRLMSRRTRHTLPIADELLKPKVVENVLQKKMLKHKLSKFQYDKGAKDLPELVIGQSIRMAPLPNDRDKKWRFGTCVEQHSPRSYVVDVNGHLYRRNRKYIRSTSEAIPESIIGDQSVFNDQCHSNDQKCVEKAANRANQSASESSVNASKNSATSEKVKVSGKSSQCKENIIHVESSPKPEPINRHPAINSENPSKSTRTRDIRPPKRYEDFV